MYLHEPVSNTLVTKAVHGIKTDRFSIRSNQGIIGLVYNSSHGIILSSPYDDPRFDRSLDKVRKSITRNLLCVPIKSANNCIGCLEVANKRANMFTEEDHQLVGLVARELAIGIININSKKTVNVFETMKVNSRIRFAEIANENLLTPLLKNIMIILSEMLKSDK